MKEPIYEHGITVRDLVVLYCNYLNPLKEHLWNVSISEQGAPIVSFLKIRPHPPHEVQITVVCYGK